MTLARYAATSDHRWEFADSLIDAALALYLIGDAAESERVRLRALELAREGKFHELEFRAERVPAESDREAASAVPLSRETRSICVEVEQLGRLELLELSGA